MSPLLKYTGGFCIGGDVHAPNISFERFYEKYGQCEEILTKLSRPYACLEMRINGVCFAIPFRHHITHKYAFITYGERGLDYTKAVVIADKSFILDATPQIEQREFNAIKGKEMRIHKGLSNYIKLYKEAKQYNDNQHYKYILEYSALKHFTEYL